LYIEERFSVCNELDRTIYQNIKKSEALCQTILKQAFKGNLTDKWQKGTQMKISKVTAMNDLKALVQAVKRNKEHFPGDFMFQLSKEEFSNLRSQIVTSSWGGRRYLPSIN